jgi:hypothetical protein
MEKTIVALLDSREQAVKAVDELTKRGFHPEDVSIITGSPEQAKILDDAAKGMLLGSVAGFLLGAATLMIPGLGLMLVAGPIGPLLAGTALGAAAGGVIGALKSKGIPEEDAQFYAEGLRRGVTLLVVRAKNEPMAAVAEEVMKKYGAVDIRERREQWKREGWNGRFEAKDKAPITPQEQREEPELTREPDAVPMPLAAVCVYELALELESPAATPQYRGPERRKGPVSYAGMDRRAA